MKCSTNGHAETKILSSQYALIYAMQLHVVRLHPLHVYMFLIIIDLFVHLTRTYVHLAAISSRHGTVHDINTESN
jgi:hypothetical protein